MEKETALNILRNLYNTTSSNNVKEALETFIPTVSKEKILDFIITQICSLKETTTDKEDYSMCIASLNLLHDINQTYDEICENACRDSEPAEATETANIDVVDGNAIPPQDEDDDNNAPSGYGKYVDTCLYDATRRYFSEGVFTYSLADVFYAGIRCYRNWIESENKAIDILDKFADSVCSYKKDIDESYQKGYNEGIKHRWLPKPEQMSALRQCIDFRINLRSLYKDLENLLKHETKGKEESF